MNRVLFIQRKAHRAGAQSCLERLLRFNAEQGGSAALLCGERGWLTAACERSGVTVMVEPFPKARSLWALLYGNRAFGIRVAGRLRKAGLSPRIVHANDHTEGLPSLAVACRIGAKTAVFLRSSAMTRRDYYKNACHRLDLVIAVGEKLQAAAQAWDPEKRVRLIHDGIFESEFAPLKEKPDVPPVRILAIGNAGEAKGWGDLAEALAALEARGISLPGFDFTGDFAGKPYASVLRGLKAECRPLQHVEDFRSLVCKYDLAVNPSRNESFGMAAIETLAAGVPLLSSRVGVIGQVLKAQEMLFEPGDVNSLAQALENLLARWDEVDFSVARAQANIRERFLIQKTARDLDSALAAL